MTLSKKRQIIHILKRESKSGIIKEASGWQKTLEKWRQRKVNRLFRGHSRLPRRGKGKWRCHCKVKCTALVTGWQFELQDKPTGLTLSARMCETLNVQCGRLALVKKDILLLPWFLGLIARCHFQRGPVILRLGQSGGLKTRSTQRSGSLGVPCTESEWKMATRGDWGEKEVWCGWGECGQMLRWGLNLPGKKSVLSPEARAKPLNGLIFGLQGLPTGLLCWLLDASDLLNLVGPPIPREVNCQEGLEKPETWEAQDGSYREETESEPPIVKSWRDAGDTLCRHNHWEEA
jgi:hypothetical protein